MVLKKSPELSMDQNLPFTPAVDPTSTPDHNTTPTFFLPRFSKKQKIISLGLLILVITGSLVFFILKGSFYQTNLPANKTKADRYLDLELSFYPLTQSAEVIAMLKQKIIDDDLALRYGTEKGLIDKDYNFESPPTQSQYLERTSAVAQVKEAIGQQVNHIEADVVSIWFYNNGEIGPLGYEKGKEIALGKITDYYNRVKSKKISIQEAGALIATDEELIKSRLNVSLAENSYMVVKGEVGKQMTFWPEFDAELWQLKPGELTTIFTGTDTDKTGKVIPVLFAFGQVTNKITDGGLENYDQWLLKHQ